MGAYIPVRPLEKKKIIHEPWLSFLIEIELLLPGILEIFLKEGS